MTNINFLSNPAAKTLRNSGGGNSQYKAQSDKVQCTKVRALNTGQTYRAAIPLLYPWKKSTVTQEELRGNHALITRLSRANNALLAGIWKYAVCADDQRETKNNKTPQSATSSVELTSAYTTRQSASGLASAGMSMPSPLIEAVADRGYKHTKHSSSERGVVVAIMQQKCTMWKYVACILMVLFMGIGEVWGTVTVPSSALDIASLTSEKAANLITASNATNSHYLSTNTDTLLLIPSDILANIGSNKKIKWATTDGSLGTTSADWSSPTGSVSFKGRTWWKSSGNINTIQPRSDRTLNIRVTGCQTVSVLCKAASTSTKYFILNAYEYSESSIDEEKLSLTTSVKNTSTTEAALSLDASKEYVIVLTGSTGDNGNLAYEIKFIAGTSCTDPGLAYTTGTVNKTEGDANFTNTLTNTRNVTVSYASDNTSVATVNSSTGEVTIVGEGTATITASSSAQTISTVDYCADNASYTLKVARDPVGEDHVLTWTVRVENSETTITTTGKESTSSYLTSISNVTTNGSLSVDNTGKNKGTGKIKPTNGAKVAANYLSMTFTVVDGYTFSPSTYTMSTTAVTAAKTVEVEISDTNGHSKTATWAQPQTSSTPDSHDYDLSGSAYSGIVTIKVWVYGEETNNGYRLGTPITLTGDVAEATPVSCDSYQFHYQHGSTWNTDPICFSPVAAESNDYLTDELYLPYAEWYNVTWQGTGQTYTQTKGFTGTTDNIPMPFYHNRGKSFGANPQEGNIGGGKGRFHVYHDSNSTNKYVSFVPTGYTLNFGSGDSWTNDSTLNFIPVSSSWNETEWYTPITTLTNAAIGRQIFVGLQTATGYVWCSPYSEKQNISSLRTKSGPDSWVDGGMSTSYASKTGKFRIYANSGDNNWYVTFVPHHKLTYNANGGSGALAAQYVSVEASPCQLTVSTTEPTRDGYTFLGWSTDDDATVADGDWDGGDTHAMTGDVTLYAVWECVTPTFGTNLSTSTVNYALNASATALTVAATAGGGTVTYQWYSNDENNTTTPTTLTGQTSASYIPSTATAGTTYYYCVATNSTSGCSTTTTSNITPVTVAKADPTKYDFSANNTSICSGDDVTFTIAGSQVGATYYVTKSSSGSSAIGDSKAGTGSALSFTVSSATAGDYYCYTTATTNYNAGKVSNSKVTISHKTAPSISSQPMNILDATVGEEQTLTVVAAGTNLSYQWKESATEDGTYSNVASGGTSASYSVTPAAAGTKWYQVVVTGDCGEVTSNKVSIVAAAAVEYTVTYNANGGTVSPTSETVSTATLPTPTKTNYTFDGWYTSSGTKAGDAGDNYEPTGDITLYALWREDACAGGGGGGGDPVEIKLFDGSEDDDFASSPITVSGVSLTYTAYDKPAEVTDVSSKTNNTGNGKNYSKGYQFSASSIDKGNPRRCMQFTIPSGYTATFTHAFGASGNSRTIMLGSSVITNISDDGYITTLSTTPSSGGSGVINGGTYSTPLAAGTYYICGIGGGWQVVELIFTLTPADGGSATCYYVTYNGNGADGGFTKDEASHASGSDVTVASNSFSREGYTFTGWNTEVDGSGTDYAAGETISGISSNMTLYAQWSEAAAALVTNTLATGNVAWSSSITTAAPSSITNLSALAATGLTISGNGNANNGGQTAKVTGTESDKNTAEYLSLSFRVACGKKLTVTGVEIPVQPVTKNNSKFEAVLTDGRTTITGTQENKTNGTLNDIEFDSYGYLQGDVTLKIYAWGWTEGYRLGKAIKIYGTIEDQATPTATIRWTKEPAGGLSGTNETVTAVSSDGSAVTITSNNSSVATVSGSTVSYVGVGSTYLIASGTDACGHTMVSVNSDNFTVIGAYDLTYNKNGGTGTMTGETGVHYAVVAENAFTAPDGKTFYGWNTAADGSGDSYQPGDAIELSANTTLYAQWGTALSATWSVKVDDKLYRGGGGYRVTVYLDQADWDESGNKDDLELTATEGVTLKDITRSINVAGKAQVEADFDITTDLPEDATQITFTLSVPAAGDYAAEEIQHDEDLEDCAGRSDGTSRYKFQVKKGLSAGNIDKKVTDASEYLSVLEGGTLPMSLSSNGHIAVATDSLLSITNTNESSYLKPTLTSPATIQLGDIIRYRIYSSEVQVQTTTTYNANTDITLSKASGANIAVTTNSMVGQSSIYLKKGGSSNSNIAYFEIWHPDEVLFFMEAKNGMTAGNLSTTETQQTTSNNAVNVSYGSLYAGSNNVSDLQITTNEYKLNGNSAYLKIELPKALQEGDILLFNSTTNYQLGITKGNSRSTTISTTNKIYTIPATSTLIGETTIYLWRGSSATNVKTLAIIRPSSSSGGKVTPTLSWEADLSGGVNAEVGDADFTHTATQNMNSLGTISYSSSNTSVATVNATTGRVHIVGAAGEATITATLAASGCFDQATATYTINVIDNCIDEPGTISTTDLGCDGIRLTVSGHTALTGVTYQWYKDGVSLGSATGAQTAIYTATVAGEYYVVVTNPGTDHCEMASTNTIVIAAKAAAEATKIVDSWYVKNGRRTPDIALVQTTNATGFSVKIGDTEIWNESVEPAVTTGFGGCGFHIDENGIIYLNGTKDNGDATSGLTAGDETLTITVNGCGGTSVELEITIHKQEATTRPSIAFVVDGTKNTGAFDADNESHSVNTALYKYLDYTASGGTGAFDLTAQNIYATTNEKSIREQYSQFDAILITDDPGTKEKPSGDYKTKGYVNAFGTMIDVRPILTMEAYVSALANWKTKGVTGEPTSPNPRQYALRLECKDHEIYKDGLPDPAAGTHVWDETIDGQTYRNVILVDSTKSPYAGLAYNEKTAGNESPALQGFDGTASGHLLGLGRISEGALQAAIERQEEPAARLLVFSIQAKALPNALTDEGKQIIENILKYLLKTNMEEVDDCSNYFVGGATGDPASWTNLGNWSKNSGEPAVTLPTYETKVRILAPCVLSGTQVNVAQIDIVNSGNSSIRKIHRSDDDPVCNGKLTIDSDAAVIVAGKVRTAEAPHFSAEDLKPTTPEDLIINTNSTKQAALILNNDDGQTQATVNLYSLGRNDGSYKYQYFAVPMEYLDVSPTFANETHGGTKIYTYVYEEASSGWIRRGYYDGLYAFEGLGITTKSGTAMEYEMKGNLASTTKKEISLTHDGAGLNLIGNSWMAPIQIGALAEDNTDANITQTAYVYCAGRDAEGGAISGDTETAGQWLAVPFEAAGFATWKETGKLTVIPAMQAFQIKTAAEATLTLDYSKVVRGSTNDLNAKLRAPGRRENVMEDEVTLSILRVTDSKTHTDLSLFEGGRFSDEFDNGWEAEFLSSDGRSAQFYARGVKGKMAVLATDELEGTKVGFEPGQEREYTIRVMGSGINYYLNDLKEKKSMLISEGNTYTFTYEEGDEANRFLISGTPFDAPQTPTDIGNVPADHAQETKAQKVIYQDKVYIIRSGKIYDIVGKVVR